VGECRIFLFQRRWNRRCFIYDLRLYPTAKSGGIANSIPFISGSTEQTGHNLKAPHNIFPYPGKGGAILFIRNCLTPHQDLATVTWKDNLHQALSVMNKHGLDSVPVVEKAGRFIGIIGYAHIGKRMVEVGDSYSKVLDLPVSSALEWINPLNIDADFEETLPVIVRHPFVPIVETDGTTFAGIVKISDIEHALSTAFGYGVQGVRFLIGVFVDVPHQLEHLLAVLQPFDVNILSIASFDAGHSAARRILLKVEPTPYVEEIHQALVDKGFRVLSVKKQ
jgi:CBS domain-containing protein